MPPDGAYATKFAKYKAIVVGESPSKKSARVKFVRNNIDEPGSNPNPKPNHNHTPNPNQVARSRPSSGAVWGFRTR